MVTTKWTARAVAVGTMSMVLAMPVGTAAADSTAYDDPVGDSTSVDISRVRVVHRDAVTVRVRSAVKLAAGQLYTFWIDAGRGPGSVYHVSFSPNTDSGQRLGLVRAFGQKPTRFVDCPRMGGRGDIFSDKIPLNDANEAFADPFHLFGFKTGFRHAWGKHIQTDLFISGDNIFDRTYSLGNDINAAAGRYYNAAPGANFKGGIVFRFEKQRT